MHEATHASRELLKRFDSGVKSNGSHQLFFAESGVVKISTNSATWMLPPKRGAWIQANTEHTIRTEGAELLRIEFDPASARSAARMAVFEMPPLAKELVRSIVDAEHEDAHVPKMQELLADLCASTWVEQKWEFYQPIPVTPEVLAATQAANRDLGIDLKEAAKAAGCSPRTLTRRFQDDIGIPWRSFLLQARMTQALELLTDGGSVTSTCHQVGYTSLGAFSNTFFDFYGFRPSAAKKASS